MPNQNIMKQSVKLLIKFIAGVITFFVVDKIVLSMMVTDFATSIEPGWHTTIFPPYFVTGLPQLTATLILFTIFIYLLFKYIVKLLNYIWLKAFGNSTK